MKSKSRKVLPILILLIAPLAAMPAGAKSGVNVGALSCTVEGGVGLIVGSSKAMECTFDPAGSGQKERYSGTISKLGLDIGVTTKSYIRWLVFAPGKIKSGALEGRYGGGSAEATVGVGLGANVLVGGFDDSIALQPVSVQGQEGLNVALGISGLRLKRAN